tara:strand:+ start:6399 stop:7763 length:1365 start_codon:yes stop_codon:yes gene_type:complete
MIKNYQDYSNKDISLDDKYKKFCNNTDAVFKKYPQLKPLRLIIFKKIITTKLYVDNISIIKRKIRHFLIKGSTNTRGKKADIIIFIEGTREVIVDNLLPLYHELIKSRKSVLIITFGCDVEEKNIKFIAPIKNYDISWLEDAYHELIRCAIIKNDLRIFNTIKEELYHTHSISLELESVFKKIQPKLVLYATNNMIAGSCIPFICKKLNIHDVLIQHGMLNQFHLPIESKLLISWGKFSDTRLNKMGISNEKYISLGSPRWDTIKLSKNDQDRKEILNMYNLLDRPILIFFSNGNDLYRNGIAPEEAVKWLEKAKSTYSNKFNILIKLHPNEDGGLYKNTDLVVMNDELGYNVIMNGCDIVCSICSSSMSEAVIYKKPVWQFYADNWPHLAEHYNHGLALRISSQYDLMNSIDDFLSNPQKYSPTLNISDVYKNQGEAAKQICRYLSKNFISQS